METMKFIHLTDTHMNAPHTEGQFTKFELANKVKQVFSHIKQKLINPSFVVITGDLSHEGNTEDYAYIRELLDEGSALLGVPVYVVLGNHDHRAPFREGYLQETPSEQAYFYSLNIQGLRLIGLNSQVAGQHHGMIDNEQLAWLEQELAVPADKGTIVALHHPLIAISGMPGDHLLTNRVQLGQALADTDVIGVISGHVHSNNVGTYQGICNVAATGTAFSGELADEDNFSMVDFCGYNVISVHPGEGITVQTVVIPGSTGEYFRFPIAMLTAAN